MRALSNLAVALAAGGALLATAAPARALDAFEIQVYDGTADAPGQAGIELHVNTTPGTVSHFTAEPSFSIARWGEVGAYLQTALRADGGFDYGGVKLRFKLLRPSWETDAVRLGLNLEVSDIPPPYDPDRWGAEVRPIIAWAPAGGRFAVAFNPILDVGLAGAGARQAPSFEPALSALFVVAGVASGGVELYGDFGPIGDFAAWRSQQHYVFEVVNVLRWKRIEVNAGVGEGLTPSSSRFVAKMILGLN
jgi:hypothetical protein